MGLDERLHLNIYRFIVRSRQGEHPRSPGYLADAHALGITAISSLECHDLYFIEGQLSEADLQCIAAELLSDSITQTVEWRRFNFSLASEQKMCGHQYVIEVALRPGVTDPVAEQLVRAAQVLGISGVERASTGQRFLVWGEQLSEEDVRLLTRRLLANPIIQRYALGEIDPVFPEPPEASGYVEITPIRGMPTGQLLALSQARRAALDLAEMQAIQAYFDREGRDPTDIELETLAQTWSEHCVHKTFKARITLASIESEGSEADEIKLEGEIDGLLRTYIRAATESIGAQWVRSAFVDNAGIIDFDHEYELSFKVETHNHPSAIEPFGGANTGVGGVIRDVLGVSARPIAATDVLCFGPQELDPDDLPEGVLHPRRIRSGVVAGVQDYGNKIGIPTVNGAILYDPGFTANPLVFCGCVGLAPKDSHPRKPRAGDHVVVLGGHTGRDGLRGATFSSMTMDGQTGEVAGASVQIGDPITEKGLIEVILRARDLCLYNAITDCGAGGLSSAVGEMAGQTGADVELQSVRLKYPGLAPWEIWLSEAQERMLLAVPPPCLPQLQSLCETFDVALTNIGLFTDSGHLVVRYAGRVVLDLENEFLHAGIPQRRLEALKKSRRDSSDCLEDSVARDHGKTAGERRARFNRSLLALLEHPNIASKADVIRLYDHEVQGATVVKPLTGVLNDGPSDGCVLKPLETEGNSGIVLANGINPKYGEIDAYGMAVSVVDESIRNAVAVGADPLRIALLDNFCWGDPRQPETLGALVEAARGCHDAALHYRTPFISGKDSLNNEFQGADGQRHAIPPTLLISSIGLIEDIWQAVTMDLKEPGDAVYLLGEHRPVFGGSHYSAVLEDARLPAMDCVPGMPGQAPLLYRALHVAMRAGLVRACHDLSEGGLAVAAAEMCVGGRLGLALQLEAEDPERALFGETNGCLLAEVRPQDCAAFETQLDGLHFRHIGQVTSRPNLTFTSPDGAEWITLALPTLVSAWQPNPKS